MSRRQRTHKNGIIYSVTCSKSDLVYIGKTIMSRPKQRWAGHCSQARAGAMTKLHVAMREYGEDAFTFTEIACAWRRADLSALEKILIEQYDSESNGYNIQGPEFWAQQSAEMSVANNALRAAIRRLGLDRVVELLEAA